MRRERFLGARSDGRVRRATVSHTSCYLRATPVSELIGEAELEKVARTQINAGATPVVIVSPA